MPDDLVDIIDGALNSSNLEGTGGEPPGQTTPGQGEPSDEGIGTEEQGEGLTPQFFGDKFDASKLPPELQKQYKLMHGSYTQKTQQIAEERRQWEQKVVEAENRLKAWENYYQEQQPAGPQQPAQEEIDLYDPGQLQAYIATQVQQGIQEGISQYQGQLKPLVNEFYQREVQQEIDSLTKSFPDWEKYREPMAKLIEQHKGLRYEDAYKVVAFESAKKAGETETLDRLNKKKNKTTETQTFFPPSKGKVIENLDDALDAAMEGMGIV